MQIINSDVLNNARKLTQNFENVKRSFLSYDFFAAAIYKGFENFFVFNSILESFKRSILECVICF